MSTMSSLSIESDATKGKDTSRKAKEPDVSSVGSRLRRFFGGSKKKKKEEEEEKGATGKPESGESESISAAIQLPFEPSLYTNEFQMEKAKEYETYLKMIEPEENIRRKDELERIFHGGRPYGSDPRDKIGHNSSLSALDGQWHLEEPVLDFDERMACELYGQHEVFQRVRKLQHQLCALKHRNVDITCQIQMLEHQNKNSTQQIEELGRQNRRLIADNTAYIAQALENQVLEQDVVSYQSLVHKIEGTLNVEDAKTFEMLRNSERCKDQRRDLLDDLQRFELTSMASGIKVDLLQKREYLMESSKIDHHLRRIMADRIQALEGSIRVFVRVRPASDQSQPLVEFRLDDSLALPVLVSGRTEKRVFNFNAVFPPSASQLEVFEGMKQLAGEFTDGKSVCLLGYGASDSGKTHSLFGPDTTTDRGFATRLVEEVLKHVMQDKRRSYKLSLSILEFHNSALGCLLSGSRCRLRDRGHLVAIEGHTRLPLTSSFEFADRLELALSKRRHVAIKRNGAPAWLKSVSDVAVVIKLASKYAYFETEEKEEKEKEREEEGVFTVVDLAGGGRSLAALDHVIEAIRSNVATVPYRRCLLTHFLRPCFEGGAVCSALLTVHDGDRKGILHTLEFGKRLMDTTLGTPVTVKPRMPQPAASVYEN